MVILVILHFNNMSLWAFTDKMNAFQYNKQLRCAQIHKLYTEITENPELFPDSEI